MAKDPYYYFRIEAQELVEGLGAGLLELENAGTPEAVRKFLRLAHTLKGAARVVKLVEVGDLAHKLEDLLAPARDNGRPDAASLRAAAGHLESVRAKLGALAAPTPAAPLAPLSDSAPARPPAEEGLQSVRLEIAELDGLIGGINDSAAAVAALRGQTHALGAAAGALETLLGGTRDGRAPPAAQEIGVGLQQSARRLQALAEQASSGLGLLRASVVELRLVPARVLLAELERSVRDAAQSLGKQVRFESSGADTRIDAAVLATLRGALRHVARNAVAHGIEDENARLAAGKPPAGNVRIAIERRGHRVAVICRDDGAGFNLETVRRAVVDRKLVGALQAAEMDSRQLIQLLLRGGVSTARELSQVAGRGIGLDVVRETVAALKGEVDIRTTGGRGTEVVVVVPISLSSLPALELEAGGGRVFAPLDSVRRSLRCTREEIARSTDGERLRFGDEFIPFADLGRVLGRPAARGDMLTVVVLEAGGVRAAIGVERVRGVREIILRNLPAHVGAGPEIAGVALDDTGVPRLVLAPAPLIAAVASVRRAEAPAPPRARPPLLVIDDSLTTRMLEQSILESAGYEVDLAVCAEDGLEMARRRRYGVFIVDVEMPGMNGFDFIARTRQDADLRETPAVLVTSRADPEDKRRGKEVGARAYVVKSEFNQQELLQLIGRLTG